MKKLLPVFCLVVTALTARGQYCTPTVFYTADEDIQNVTFNTINNTSPSLCNGYTDYTSISTTVTLGSMYPISINTSDCEGSFFYDRSVGVWIDLNIDGDFDDAGELVFTGPYGSNAALNVLFSGNITIPVSATTGSTRMRVTCVEDDIIYYGPCDAVYWGEVEDYTLIIAPNTPCTAPPTAGTTTTSNANPCPLVNFNLGLTGGTIGTGQTYQWQSSPDNIAWTDIVGATTANYTGSITDTTWYRCIVTCSGQSDTSTVLAENLAPFYNCYCTPTTTYGCAIDYIANVTFESINNTTTCGSTYNDFTSMYTANVIQGNTYPLSVTTDGDSEGAGVWIDFDHSGTFDVSEFVLSGYTGNQPETYTANVTIPLTAATGLTRMRVRCKYANTVNSTEPCSNFTYGEIEDYMVMISPPPANDGGLLSILSPSVPPSNGCSVNDTIVVAFNTIGTNNLTSLDFNYTVNGGAPTTYSWTGNLSQYQSDTVQIGITPLVDGDVLKVWVSNPNGVADEYALNDTAEVTLYDAMSGVYTIGGASPDFVTINDAADALEMRGVCGPVTMNIRSGNYTEQVSMGAIPGASSVNTITFQSEVLDATQVVVDYTPFITNENFVLRYDGCSWITWNEVTLSNTSSLSHVVEFINDATDNTLQHCIVIGDTLTASTTFDRSKVTIWSGTDEDNNTTIRNNEIYGGEWGISMWGSAPTTIESGLVIDSNLVTGYYQAGLVLVYQNRPTVRWNTITSDTLNPITNIFHLDIEQSYNGAVIVGNHVSGRQGGFGINLFNIEAQANIRTLVANNFVYMGNNTTTTYAEAIAIQDCSNGDIVNNSVHNRSMQSNSGGIRMFFGNSAGFNILNNNIVHSGAGYAFNSENPNYINSSDYNNFYTDSTHFVRLGTTDYADLSALQTGTGMDMHSVSVDPQFAGEDLHTCRVELDNAATPFAGITDDFDRDIRSVTTPDIGADEFLTPQNFTLGPDILKCPNDSIFLAGEQIGGATYYWSPYFQTTSGIWATASGTYVVQIASSCGAAVDTVQVTNYPLPTASFTYTTSFYTAIMNNTSTNGVSYHWDFGDSNTSTDFEPNHVYATNGTYTVTLTVVSDCGDTATFTQTVTVNPQFAGIESDDVQNLSIYPNPSDGYFNIAMTTAEVKDVRLTVMDISGRTIYTGSHIHEAGSYATPLDLRGYPAGSYILEIHIGKTALQARLIIR